MPRLRETGDGPCARWCDAAFATGEPHDLDEVVAMVNDLWPDNDEERWVAITGGEPMLQLNVDLVHALHREHWLVALETNGTLDGPAIEFCDHVCVSPKRGTTLAVHAATELKVVLPGAWEADDGWTDEELGELVNNGEWEHIFVQPQDYLVRSDVVASTALVPRERGGQSPTEAELEFARFRYDRAVEQCLEFVNTHPAWRLSLQTNKFLGMP